MPFGVSSVPQRLEAASVPEPNTGCLLWLLSVNRKGYGQMRVDGRLQYVHRLAYVAANGPIPAGKKVCHRCDQTICIEPAHLWLGMDLDNARDCVAKGRRPRGDKHHMHLHPELCARGEANHSKLTAADVKVIRATARAFARRAASYRELGRCYGVSYKTISAIVRRVKWRHVK